MAAQRKHCLFTVELLLASGCEDNPHTRQMVDTLNGISRLWGREVTFYLEKIINTVKSKSDELRSVLDFGVVAPLTGSQSADALETRMKALEEENRVLLVKSKGMETAIATAKAEITALKTENNELKQPVCVTQEKITRAFLKSYNARCVELDGQKYETSRLSIWYTEQLLAIQQTKATMESIIGKKDQQIKELQSQLVSESLQVNVDFELKRVFLSDVHSHQKSIFRDLTSKDSTGMSQQKKSSDLLVNIIHLLFHCVLSCLTLLQTFIDPIDKTIAVCPVPMSNGYLISLKHVYNSWKKDGVKHKSTDWNSIPPFKLPDSIDRVSLARPDQILLIHHITLDLGISAEPPFKVQYNLHDQDGDWTDIMLTDQIRIASVMYQMKHALKEVSKISRHCLVQKNQFLVEISLEQQVFEFKIKEAESNPAREVRSRLIVSDSSYELF
jgi:hypothetical protein